MLKSVLLAAASFAVLAGSAAADPIDPALYVVRDADSTLYLYGTVHVRPAGADWADEDVRAALAEAQEIWTEIEMSPAADAQAGALAQQSGAAPPDKPLSSWLTPEENARLNAYTQTLGLPAGALEGLQPWLAAITLTIVPILRAGYDPQSGVDRSVDAFGDANGRTMRAFETVEQQIGFLSGMSPQLQREMLLDAISEGEEMLPMMAELTRAWEQGDQATLERLVVADTRDEFPELYRSLFLERNNAWMEIITRELDGAGIDFVAVGAGHVVGEDGLVAQLRARGYTVERVVE